MFLCPTCGDNGVPGKTHAATNTERIRVAVSITMLHKFWQHNYEGDSTHTEYITIPGATIDSFEFNWRGDFRHEKLPQDVVVVAGLNNFIKNQKVDQIMEEVEAFYPPQFKWFPTDGPCPYPEENNKLNLMMNLNERIMAFNEKIFQELFDIYY